MQPQRQKTNSQDRESGGCLYNWGVTGGEGNLDLIALEYLNDLSDLKIRLKFFKKNPM